MTVHERNDLEMIRHPDNWPIWPVLPMKRNVGGQLEMGYFWNPSIYRDIMTFYIGNIYDQKHALEQNTSPEQVLQEGWRVD